MGYLDRQSGPIFTSAEKRCNHRLFSRTSYHLTELNYDIKDGSLCTGGAPRFNVVTTDGINHFVGGCANGTQTPAGSGWTHVVFDTANASQAFPVLTASDTVKSIELILDEHGTANVDNISVNEQVISGPVAVTDKDACKNGGYKDVTDANGNGFKNQGQCVSYVNGRENHQNQNALTKVLSRFF
jgi:hypothetical protein